MTALFQIKVQKIKRRDQMLMQIFQEYVQQLLLAKLLSKKVLKSHQSVKLQQKPNIRKYINKLKT